VSGLVRYGRVLGSVPRARTEEWVLIGQDGGQSVDLGGQTLFFFSDTLLAPRPAAGAHLDAPPPPFAFDADGPCSFLGNCAGLGAGDGIRPALAGLRYLTDDEGLPVEILPPTPAERAAGIRFWPQHGVLLDGRVYVFYLGIQATGGSSVWDFRTLGAGVAALDPASGDCRRVCPGGDWLLWPATADDLHLGVQVVAHAGHLYVYGSRRRGLTVEALLGRVPPGSVADPGAYRFLQPATGRWAPDLDDAGGLGPCGADYSVSYNAHLGAFLMVYADSFAATLRVRTADRPEGPWSPPETVGRLPHLPSSELVYLAFEHPTFAADGGRRLAVTYSQPSFTPNTLLELGLA
jgi:hypothetical protein